MLTVEEYDELEKVLFGAAKGGGEPRTVSETQTEEYVKDGRRRHNSRTRKVDEPDVALAMKLLDERIGGPQDFC